MNENRFSLAKKHQTFRRLLNIGLLPHLHYFHIKKKCTHKKKGTKRKQQYRIHKLFNADIAIFLITAHYATPFRFNAVFVQFSLNGSEK